MAVQFLLHRGDTVQTRAALSLASSSHGVEMYGAMLGLTYGIEVPCIATNIEILHESNAQIQANQRSTARNHEIKYIQHSRSIGIIDRSNIGHFVARSIRIRHSFVILNGVSNFLSTDSFSNPALQSLFKVQSLRFVAQPPTHLKG